MEWFIVHYCTHFDTIDPIFKNEMKFIEETKTLIAEKAQIVAQLQNDNAA